MQSFLNKINSLALTYSLLKCELVYYCPSWKNNKSKRVPVNKLSVTVPPENENAHSYSPLKMNLVSSLPPGKAINTVKDLVTLQPLGSMTSQSSFPLITLGRKKTKQKN